MIGEDSEGGRKREIAAEREGERKKWRLSETEKGIEREIVTE